MIHSQASADKPRASQQAGSKPSAARPKLRGQVGSLGNRRRTTEAQPCGGCGGFALLASTSAAPADALALTNPRAAV